MSNDPASEQELAGIREEIDRIDRQIQELLNRRAGCAQRVAEVKKAE
ncbi:MAG: chorismate mutase, partial [Gammaproteobacteria bacterium]